MSNTGSWSTCQIVCWVIAAFLGLLAFLAAREPTSFIAALLVGAALAVFLGLVLTRLFCASGTAKDAAMPGAAAASAAGAAMAGAASKAGEAASAAADTAADLAGKAAEKGAEVASAAKDAAVVAAEKAGDVTGAVAEKAAEVTDAAKDAASSAADTVADKADAAADAAAETGAAVKSGTLLKGEEDLASRKGEWKYDAGATTSTTPDYDKDGVHEGTDEGARPEALSAPRDGQADNLKEIKGVGPKLEQMLHGMGFYHFDQIAAWTADEVAWVDANLQGFKGRVSRDNWVEQAKILAVGGETEFSKRVEDGDVY